MAQSQNGYRANDIDRTKTWTIPGTTRQVRLHAGDAGWLLVHFAAWFHKNVESIDRGQLDDWGYAERPIRGSSTTLSNHASGTAIDLNAVRHPLGVRGTFTGRQVKAIRSQLREYDGVIRWGGDYQNRADEMHFEIVGDSDDVARVADRLQKATAAPARSAPKPGQFLFEKASIRTYTSLLATHPMKNRTKGPVVRKIRQVRWSSKAKEWRGRVRPLAGRWYSLTPDRAKRIGNL